jgi:hypothetical protein
MKHAIGLLYLATACVGFYWSLYLTLTGLYGVPFSVWYVQVSGPSYGDGVDIRVVERNGRIVSGYPTNLPRNPPGNP